MLYYITSVLVCYITYVMSYNMLSYITCYVMLYNICSAI